MKPRTLIGFALIAAALAAGLLPQPTLGEAAADDPAVTAAIDEITKQQTAIIENQAKIDEKLALIGEDIRVARIFVGRGGGKVK